MNREIEFRIWTDNQFYYKCLVGNTNDTTDDNWTCPMVWLEDKKEWVHCDNGIISQYTGLKDKNGKKIFEGDIVHYDDFTSVYSREVTGKVIYSQDCMFEIEYDDEFIKNHKTTRPLVCNEHPIFTEKKIEVIGNIYENQIKE